MGIANGQSGAADFHSTASLDEQRIARVYAEALLNAAEARGAVADVQEELREVSEEIFRQQPLFEEFLASGIIGRNQKKKVLEAVFAGKTSQVFYNFLMVLAAHDRLNILRSIHQAYCQILDERRRRMTVHVRSAVPLTEDQLNRLRDELRETFQLDPVLHTKVDPSILGGLVVRVGDWVFDRSVRNELKQIEKQLLARSSSEIANLRDRVGSI